ncbi:MAG: ABC transporter ATP-binding protein [Verrucomicrobiota bacterium JB023]|nr:ABC transporter ATP-binding protein [Verrucomicrobiota bacterium JB023]
MHHYPAMALGVLALAIGSTVLVLVPPLMTKRFIDVIIGEGRQDLIWSTMLIAVGAIALRQLLVMVRTVLNTAFEQRVVHDLRRELFDKIQRMPLNFFDKRTSGDIMSRVGNDVPAMEKVIIQGIDQGLSGIIQIVAIVGFMLYHHVGLTLVTLAPMPVVGLITWLYSKYGAPRYTRAAEASADLNATLHDSLAGIRQIKAYTTEPEKLLEFSEKSDEVRASQMHVVKANAITWPSVSFVAESGIVIMLAMGSWWLLDGKLESFGIIGAFLFAWGYLFEPISRLSSLGKTFTGGAVSGKRVFEILDDQEEPNLTGGERPDQFNGEVTFENLHFGYTEGEPILRGVSLEASAGQTIAFVGPTGSGKSTLLNLLTGFYHPWEGRLLLDGHAVKNLSKEWLRDHTGYVTQESFLFNTTLRQNLLLAKPDATDDELWQALDAANASPFVSELPDGLDTVTGERGTKLSGGQRQRISIARALLKNPPMLLLDEATSAVDNETERLIQEALQNLRAQRTSFVIAHRLTTVQEADLICVLVDGRIKERGTHDGLLAKGGLYAELWGTRSEDNQSGSTKRLK